MRDVVRRDDQSTQSSAPVEDRLGCSATSNASCSQRVYGSWLLTDGVDVAYVTAQMGHRSIAITEKHYATYMKSKSVDVLAKRNALIAERSKAENGNLSFGTI
jgi:hypothetical protein